MKARMVFSVTVFIAGLATSLSGCAGAVDRGEAPERTGETVAESTAAESIATSPTQNDPITTGRIICEPSGETRVLTPQVEARPDGVHFVIDNRHGLDTEYMYTELGFGSVSLTGASARAPVGESEHTKGFPPGEVEIACYEPSARGYERSTGSEQSYEAYEELDYGTFEVVDPKNVFRSVGLGCSEGETGTGYLYGSEGTNGSDDASVGPVELARYKLSDQLQEGDVVQLAEYPKSRDPDDPKVVRVVRDDRVVAWIEYLRGSGGGWSESSNKSCAEF